MHVQWLALKLVTGTTIALDGSLLSTITASAATLLLVLWSPIITTTASLL